MEGNRREEIRKGPWKAEEDEVLVNHVKKYGPRDWSSIRSKGLLHRTGKSCRLRWVNKLRPNLKNGCKFSAEEERVVIDLQAQFGNKWAKIATFLPGRTDNDVKNFWSSRQKRLARILQTSAATPCSSSTNSKPQHKVKKDPPAAAFHDVPTFEGPMINSSMEEESSCKPQSRSSSHVENPESIRMAPLPGIVKTELPSCDENLVQDDSQFDFPFSPESLELLARLGDPSCIFSAFGEIGPLELGGGAPLCLGPPLFGSVTSCGHGARDVKNSGTPDTFFDDFPEDMFDQIEPLPSPSEW